MSAEFNSVERKIRPDTLVIHPGRARKVIVKSGSGKLTRGAVLGRVSADRKFLLSVLAATDGSQVPEVILSEDVDATSADVEAIAYQTGTYDANVVTATGNLGAGHTLETLRDAFRTKQVYLDVRMKSYV